MARTIEQTMKLLQRAHEEGRLAHAFLVTGTRGVGKEELVCRVSEMLNGRRGSNLAETESELLRVVRPEGKRRQVPVDKMRSMEQELHTKLDYKSWRIGVIVDADRLNASSENAFLKTLEEPPRNTILFLLSNRPDGLLPTVHSRCVRLELVAPGEVMVGDDEQLKHLVELMREELADGLGDEVSALTLAARLGEFFNAIKTTYQEEAEAAFALEKERYGETTDSNRWLKDRQEALIAIAEGRFLTVRAKLVDFLIAWFGDAVRCKGGGNFAEVPELADLSRALAQAEGLESLLRRMEALEAMRSNLETNASAQLVLEVACLRAFAA